MIVGLVLIYSTLIIFFNIVVDSLYAVLDPRIRSSR
jgi:ABC-type dipeptide/oligopeptide/nickel transport system permease component